METEEKIREEVAKFLESKPKNRIYPIHFTPEEGFGGEYIVFQKFEPEIQESLKKTIEKYGIENINKHLDEVIEDEDYRSDLFPDNISEINFDTEYNVYEFTMYLMKKDGSLKSQKIGVEWTSELYAHLLTLCVEDPGMNFNKLHYADKDLYLNLLYSVDSNNCDDGFYDSDLPYLLTMDEAMADADEIRKKFPELELKNGSIGYFFR